MLSAASVVLLDFDGPICAVFANLSAVEVVVHLQERLTGAGLVLPPSLAEVRGPHLLLQWLPDALVREGMPECEVRHLTRSCHHWLAEAERVAVKSARATAGAFGAIAGIVASGRSVRIVSNNAATAIMDYLCRDGSGAGTWRLDHVFGRLEDPSLMKPNPHLLLEALKPLGPLKAAEDCVFIGDAPSDVVAAAEAGVNFIGFTGGVPRRRKRLLDAGVEPELVIDAWGDLGDLSLLL